MLLGCALLSGCAAVQPLLTLAYKDGASIVQCGAQEKGLVDKALTDGKVSVGEEVIDWLSFVAMNLECVAPVVGDIITAYRLPSMSTSITEWPDGRPSDFKIRRAHAALALCQSAGVCK